MPHLIFLGIENPLGVLGQKIRGIVTEEQQLAPIASVTADVWDVKRYAATRDKRGLTTKYTSRADSIDEKAQKILVNDTVDNRQYVLNLLKNKGNHPNVRLAMCGSLNSLLKYLGKLLCPKSTRQVRHGDHFRAWGRGLH
jgi:hypothetical protein